MITTTAVTINSTGITAPSYADVLLYLQTQYKAIFGADIYLGNDSQDGQFLGVLAQAIVDANSATVAAYNSFSPSTAQSSSLSRNVKINGITRNIATKSTAPVTLVGQANTVIDNGIVQDGNGVNWNLPASVTIPSGGSISVTATCSQDGAVAAASGTINKIVTPVYGWQSVASTAVATLGNIVETDAALRVRQQKSVSLPSQTIFEGILAAVLNLTGVTRGRGYENNTDVIDANGIGPHTIALVIEGGIDASIAAAVAAKITPGTGTHGSIVITVFDAYNSTHTIKFDRPIAQAISVQMDITALAGYDATVKTLIAQRLADFFNSLGIGNPVLYFDCLVPAKLDNTGQGLTYKINSFQIKKGTGAFGTADLPMLYDEVATGSTVNVTITGA